MYHRPLFRCSIQLSETDLQRYAFYAFRRIRMQPGWRSGLYWLLVGCMLCWPFYHLHDWTGMALFGAGYTAIIAIGWRQAATGRWLFNQYGRPRRWLMWWVQQQVQQRCRQPDMRWWLQPLQIELTPQSIVAAGQSGRVQLPLSQLQIAETFEYIYCYTRRDRQFIILPKAQLPQAVALSQLLQAYHRQQTA